MNNGKLYLKYGTVTNMILEKLGIVWLDRDGSFHYLPVGD